MSARRRSRIGGGLTNQTPRSESLGSARESAPSARGLGSARQSSGRSRPTPRSPIVDAARAVTAEAGSRPRRVFGEDRPRPVLYEPLESGRDENGTSIEQNWLKLSKPPDYKQLGFGSDFENITGNPRLFKTKTSKHAPSFFRVPGVYHPKKAPAQPWAGGESITKMPKQVPGEKTRKGISPDAPLWFHDQMQGVRELTKSGMMPSQSYHTLSIGRQSILAPDTQDPEDQPVQAPGSYETEYEFYKSRAYKNTVIRPPYFTDFGESNFAQ